MFYPSQTPGILPTIYTNVSATSVFLVKKYLPNNSVPQTQVRALFDPENFPSSTPKILRTAISSEDVPTPPVDSLRSLCLDILYMNMRPNCLQSNSSPEYVVISSDVQLSMSFAYAYALREWIR